MARIGNVDLGNVELVEPIEKGSFSKKHVYGGVGSFSQSMISYDYSWRIKGHLHSPTQAEREKILNLQNGEVMLVDVDAFCLFGYGKVTSVRLAVDNEYKNVYNYSIEVDGCPAIGHTHVHTDDVYLHDLDYRMNLKSFDPHFKHFNTTYSSDRLDIEYEFYVDNDKASIQDALLEIQVGDVNYSYGLLHLSYYNGTTYVIIGTFGWGNSGTFVDPSGGTHVVNVDGGTRGTAKAIGTVSYKLGTTSRTLLKIGSLGAHSGTTNISTEYGGDQLLLKVKLAHSAVEPGVRDYIKITYVDGSLDYGPA